MRKRKFQEGMCAEAARLLDAGQSYRHVARQFGVHHTTLFAHLGHRTRPMSEEAERLKDKLLEFIAIAPNGETRSPEEIMQGMTETQRRELDAFCRRVILWVSQEELVS